MSQLETMQSGGMSSVASEDISDSSKVLVPGRVSIIIPAYNYGDFLAEAINSALNQGYKDVEVIVVDDGSTDDTANIAASFGNKITYIYQENQGVVAARNNGAAVAKGEYLNFLDADDWLDSNFVGSLMAALSKATDRIAYVYTDMCLVRGDEQSLLKSKSYSLPKLMFINIVPLMCVIKTKSFLEVGGFAADDSKGYSFEDWDLWLTLAERGMEGQYVPGSKSFYRLHGAGRNTAGEEHHAELVSGLRVAHPKLYKNIRLRLSMEAYRWWFIFDDRVVKRIIGNGTPQ